MDVLTFNAFDNDNTPESPILFSMEFGLKLTTIKSSFKNKLTSRLNKVMDVLTFNAFDNDNTPDSPIPFSMGSDTKQKGKHHKTMNSVVDSIL